jgi:tetratricopeptide (TPR) repeat protein
VDLLPPADAAGLLRTLIGARAEDDQAAIAALAAQCCRLPLALRVAAELAAARPVTPLDLLVNELADQRQRLNLLDAGGDPYTAVRAVFSWSWQHLDPAAAHVFRLASLHPGARVDSHDAAALADTTAEQAGRQLEALARAHLIQPTGRGRYGMHDLLRSYGRELAEAHEDHYERQAALTRLLDHYLGTAAVAMDILYPAERHHRPRAPRPAVAATAVAGSAEARAWLDTRRENLVAMIVHAARGWPSRAIALAATVSRDLDTCGHYPEAVTIHTCASRAARHVANRTAEATALTSLGVVEWRRGRFQQAASNLRLAVRLYRGSGDRAGLAAALGNLGLVELKRGSYQQAIRHYQQALALYREVGDRIGEARALGCLGDVDRRQGRYQEATSHLLEALAVYRETGNRTGEAQALVCLGDVDRLQGRYRRAARRHRQALALNRDTGNRPGEAAALNGLGNTLAAAGQRGQARAQHYAALTLAAQIGDVYEQAHAHYGLGRACLAAGQPASAARHWQRALTLYTSLAAPETGQVRASLEKISAPAGAPSSPQRADRATDSSSSRRPRPRPA